MLHTMYYADEVRNFAEIDRGETAKIKDGELDLAVRLIDELANPEFHPEHYEDEYRTRVLEVVDQKVEGREITAVAPQLQQAQVIDLMDALKASLEKHDRRPQAAQSKGPAVAAKPKEIPEKEAEEVTFEEFQAALDESGLKVGASELQRSYNGLTSLKKRKKLAPADVRAKVINLQRDLKVIQSEPELLEGQTKKLKAARIPMTARDWERY